MRINAERGQVADFSIQYETPHPSLAEEHCEVIRYDGSHGHAHYHVFDRRGREIKQHRLPEYRGYNEAVQSAINDLDLHWRRYPAAFLRGTA